MDFSTVFYPNCKENVEYIDAMSFKLIGNTRLFCVNFYYLTNAEEIYVEFYINRINDLENTDNITFMSWYEECPSLQQYP
jgi:hypothetical protein